MSTVILANPSSGRGRGEAAAGAIAAALGPSARVVLTRPGGLRSQPEYLDAALKGADTCIIVGGDGTLHGALPSLMTSGVRVYHAAMGTENLFTREFGMQPDPAAVLAAIRAGRTLRVDVGVIRAPGGDHPSFFALMCSLGPDAGVTRRLAAIRRGRITHASYLLPVLGELADPCLPRVSVWVDGTQAIRDRRGWLLVCNSRQYGFRVDPGLRASMTDGLLDVVFFPADSGMEALNWFLASRTRRHVENSELVYVQGSKVRIECDSAVLQADGDHLDPSPGTPWDSLDVECVPRALNVLLPQ